jgi:hypothetical protein
MSERLYPDPDAVVPWSRCNAEQPSTWADCDCRNSTGCVGVAAPVTVPAAGEFYVRNGKVQQVVESEWVDSDDDCEGIMIWAKRADE